MFFGNDCTQFFILHLLLFSLWINIVLTKNLTFILLKSLLFKFNWFKTSSINLMFIQSISGVIQLNMCIRQFDEFIYAIKCDISWLNGIPWLLIVVSVNTPTNIWVRSIMLGYWWWRQAFCFVDWLCGVNFWTRNPCCWEITTNWKNGNLMMPPQNHPPPITLYSKCAKRKSFRIL